MSVARYTSSGMISEFKPRPGWEESYLKSETFKASDGYTACAYCGKAGIKNTSCQGCGAQVRHK